MSLLTAGAIVIAGAISFALLTQEDEAAPEPTTSHDEAVAPAPALTTLMVKRASNTNGYKWERVQVPTDQVDSIEQELLSDPDVLAVERDTPVSAD